MSAYEADNVPDDEGDEGGYDFPPELDEFLEYCVSQHGHDWEAISGDFMDIACELEESLVERAAEAFSPEALRERYLRLFADSEFERVELELEGRESEDATTTSASATPQLTPSAEASMQAFALQSGASVDGRQGGQAVGETSATARPGWMDLLDSGTEPPSDFSIFKDSLKDQIDKIYSEVQSKLPTSVLDNDDDEDEEDDDLEEEGDGDFAGDSNEALNLLDGLDGVAPPSGSPNFNAVLLSVGINPNNVTGPTLPAEFGTAPQPQPQSQAKAQAQEQAVQSKPAPVRDARLRRTAASQQPQADSDNETEEDGEHDLSDDSADEDFLAMRQSAKQSSLQIMSTPSASSTAPAPTSSSRDFAPPPRPKKKPQEARRPLQKFVKLDLVASSEEEAENEELAAAQAAENAGSDFEDLDQAAPDEEEEHLHVMRRLLARAPHGDGAWDVWLEATRAWPRLQLHLGSPNFFQRDGDLRVSFDVEKLRSVLQEEQTALEERRAQRKVEAEQLSLRTAEFVQEAEKRRELMAQRIGSFVLTPQRSELRAA